MLKSLNEVVSLPLCRIFNQSILEGKFPESMKIAEVIPLYKGKERDMVINYRPISLLVMISKVLEKIMYKRVYKFIDKNNILYNSQYGFRNQKSCEHAITELVAKVLHAKEDGKLSASIFLDLSKAFDTLNHEVLLQKLECYGLRDTVNKWFES